MRLTIFDGLGRFEKFDGLGGLMVWKVVARHKRLDIRIAAFKPSNLPNHQTYQTIKLFKPSSYLYRKDKQSTLRSCA
jgi:hypothetical protein